MSREIRPLHAVNERDVEWEKTRFGTTYTKCLSFRDGIKASIDRFDPHAHTFPHQHGFRQLRMVLDGEFIVNGVTYGQGTMIDFPALTEYEVKSPAGGTWLVIQAPDSQTGQAPESVTGNTYDAAQDAS